MAHYNLLLVEDDAAIAALYKAYLEQESCNLTHVTTGAEALSLLESGELPDVVLLDLTLPDMNGQDILRWIRERELPTEVVVVTGDGALSTAVESMRLGASDFIVKPFGKERLYTTLGNVIERSRLSQMLDNYRELDQHGFGGFIGSSLEMQSVYRIIESAASSRATVFITGESGTGKEVCAESIHQHSSRAKGPFIAINCSAIPGDLIESEVFGHIKGAFTGALNDRKGAAQQADGGTLFLDEICEMDLELQPKLLRFLQTGRFQSVGSSKTREVDVRIICATNRDPLEEVRRGRFREDLYYRLHVLPIMLPPLRERDGDVLEIAQHFLALYATEEHKVFTHFSPEAERLLSEYGWPGNVRQLQNVIRNIVVLNQGETVTEAMLQKVLVPESIAGTASKPAAPKLPTAASRPATPTSQEIRRLADVEREAIEQAIAICDGNIADAAYHLGISAATIYRKKAAWRE
ncbi:sigma-54 dependent transcriptional regulator [Marinobacterium maritimum]|uniref:Sigma-54 dependent transcriptional regulator n=1 Tax=Marinobacterium maritimum TaxID=500162 RepID=A0ABP3TG99_9GAMM